MDGARQTRDITTKTWELSEASQVFVVVSLVCRALFIRFVNLCVVLPTWTFNLSKCSFECAKFKLYVFLACSSRRFQNTSGPAEVKGLSLVRHSFPDENTRVQDSLPPTNFQEIYVVIEQATETDPDQHTVADRAVDIDQNVFQTLPKRLCVCGTKSR